MDFRRPETWFALGMFVVSLLVSVYANETRQLLAWPFQRIRRRAAEIDEQRLAIAKRVQGNAYELEMYLLETLLGFGRQYFRRLVWLFIPAVWIEVHYHSWFKARDIVFPLLWGTFLGLLDDMSATLRLIRKSAMHEAAND